MIAPGIDTETAPGTSSEPARPPRCRRLACQDSRTKCRFAGYLRKRHVMARNAIWIKVSLKAFCKWTDKTERHMRRIIDALRYSSLEFEFAVVFDHDGRRWHLLCALKRNLCWDQTPLFWDYRHRPRHPKRHIRLAKNAAIGPPPFLKPESDISTAPYNRVPFGTAVGNNSRLAGDCFPRKFSERSLQRCHAAKKLLRKILFERKNLEFEHEVLHLKVNFPVRHAFNYVKTALLHGYECGRMFRAWRMAVREVHAANIDGLTISEPALLMFHAKRFLFSSDDLTTTQRARRVRNQVDAPSCGPLHSEP